EAARLDVAKNADDGRGAPRQDREDHYLAAEQGKRADAQAHLGEDAQNFPLVFDDSFTSGDEGLGIKRRLLSEAIPSVGPDPHGARQPRKPGADYRTYVAAHVTNVVVAVTTLITMFAIRRAINVYTTVSLTALPTPCGPPPAVIPL